MKNLTQFLFMLLCICLPATAFADANKDKDDDSKYLAGAVPEVDGKVVFTKEFSIPGMSQEEIFKRIQAWMEARLKKNANTSRVVYTNPEEGQIVGTGDEWIVFSRENPFQLSRRQREIYGRRMDSRQVRTEQGQNQISARTCQMA